MVTVSYSTKPLSFGLDIFFGEGSGNIKGKIHLRAIRIVLGTLQTKPGGKEGTAWSCTGAQHLSVGWFFIPANPWPNQ